MTSIFDEGFNRVYRKTDYIHEYLYHLERALISPSKGAKNRGFLFPDIFSETMLVQVQKWGLKQSQRNNGAAVLIPERK